MAAAEAGIHNKKASLLSLEALVGKRVHVMCVEYRTIRGVLAGFDSNMNLVLGNAFEELRDVVDPSRPRLSASGTPMERNLGAIILRGGCVMTVCPSDSKHVIENPFT